MLRLCTLAGPRLAVRLLTLTRAFSDKLNSEFRRVIKEEYEPRKVPALPDSKYGGQHIVTLLTDDTPAGQQSADNMKRLLASAKAPLLIEHIVEQEEPDLDGEAVVAVMRNRCALKISLQHDERAKRKQFVLNKTLGLYGCIIFLKSIVGYKDRFPNLDLMLIIQNISDDYTKLEYEPASGVVETLRHSDDSETLRYLNFVFKHARANQRRHITFAHKSDELPLIEGHFLKLTQKVHKKFDDIRIDFMSVNNVVLNLIHNPHIFDVICSSERYGTTIAAVSAAVCGGASLFSAVEMGDNRAMFKPLQSKISLTEYETVSAYGLVSTCIDLLRFLGVDTCAYLLCQQLHCAMLDLEMRTPEYGGCCTDEDIICHISEVMESIVGVGMRC